MPSIKNKLTVAVAFKMSQQCQKQNKKADSSCKKVNSYAESLIEVLSLQAHIRSKVRLAANDFVLQVFKANFNTFDMKMKFNILKIDEKKSNILNLIKVVQKLNLQCR